MKLFISILIIVLLASAICSAQYILFRDTLPECKVIELCEDSPELTADVLRLFGGGITVTYRPDIQVFTTQDHLQFHAGILDGRLAIGTGLRYNFNRSHGEIFKQRATHGFIIEGDIFYSKDFFLRTGAGYKIVFHKSFIGRYAICEPGLNIIIGKKSYAQIGLNIGVGL